MASLLTTWLFHRSYAASRRLSDSRGEISVGGVVAIGLLLVAYWRFPEVFEGFINTAFDALEKALASAGDSQEPKQAPKPVLTTTN